MDSLGFGSKQDQLLTNGQSRRRFRVLFVYPNLMLQTTFPTSIALMSAALKKNGFEADLFDTTFYKTEEMSSDEYRMEHLQIARYQLGRAFSNLPSTDQMYTELERKIREYKPDLIALSFVEDVFPLAKELVEVTRKYCIPTIAGGLFPTFAPEKVISIDGIDMICLGDGEDALIELCDRMEKNLPYTSVPSLWVKKEGKIYKNGMGPPADINRNPFPDFTIFDDRRFYRPMKGQLLRQGVLETDRGCPYTCTFCNTYGQELNYKDKLKVTYRRLKDIGKIHDELKILVDVHRVEFIYFASEVLFSVPRSYRQELVKMYKKFRLPFFCQNRAEVINEETVSDLVAMNCHTCSLGIEHGNEKFRWDMLRRKVSDDTYVRGISCFKGSNITVSLNNILGFPDETRDLVFDTIELNRKFKDFVFQINAYYFTPYHGSPLRQYCLDKGYVDPEEQVTHVNKDTIINSPYLSRETIRGLVRTFTLYVRLPESRWKEVEVAEKFDEEGNRKFKQLQEEYWNNYLRTEQEMGKQEKVRQSKIVPV